MKHVKKVTVREAQIIDITFQNLPGLLLLLGSMWGVIKHYG